VIAGVGQSVSRWSVKRGRVVVGRVVGGSKAEAGRVGRVGAGKAEAEGAGQGRQRVEAVGR
jgi:hypothetical protein